ncbi:MAG: HIT domain-containing protein [Celeribacter sp.]|jgi:histidine triad (HIT) family protein
MPYDYDPQNIFAKILRGEIPSQPVLETEHSIAFPDISPQAPTHILVLPRGPYVCYDHFIAEASDAEILDFTRAVAEVCRMTGLCPGDGKDGYRVLFNSGLHSGQEVPHLHAHVVGGRPLGPLLARD